nr:hypothetical protein [uncultured Flavobacterium sp.]
MEKLLLFYDLKTPQQYYTLIVNEANKTGLASAETMFKAMPTKHKAKFLKALTMQNWLHGLNKEQIIYFFDNF